MASRRGPAGEILAAGGSSWPLFVFAFLLLICGLLVGPRLPEQYEKAVCVGNVHLAPPFGFGLNCDSPEFMWLARDPAGLLLPDSPRQSRPGLVMAAAILQKPLSLVVPPGGPPEPVGQGIYDPPRIVAAFWNGRPAYFAYILLNAAILLAAYFFLQRVIAPRRDVPPLLLASIGIVLVANDVTKAFFWSPHTQMFNIFVPVLATYAVCEVLRGRLKHWTFAAALGCACGFGLTAYAVFIVVPICVVPPALWVLVRTPAARGRRFLNLVLFLALAALPSLAWYALVLARNGEYFQFEAEQGQVVWMIEAWADGTLARDWFRSLADLIGAIGLQAAAPFALMVWIAAVMTLGLKRWRAPWPRSERVLAGFYVSIAVLGFYTCVRWPETRLAYAALPAIIVAAGAGATDVWRHLGRGHRDLLSGGISAIAIVQAAFVVLKNGPWS